MASLPLDSSSKGEASCGVIQRVLILQHKGIFKMESFQNGEQ
jgi:hypothetical protein